ncbi:MAG: Uma2 family endonuclease [Gemmataceae bacterium]|nr:Uma2 family endonuclease [Gemmataceae bacterium]
MSTAAPAAVTPDDLLRMGDAGKRFELVNGELRERDMSKESCRVAGEVYFRLRGHAGAAGLGWVYPEGNSYRCFPDDPGRVRRADTSFVSFARMPVATYEDEGHCTTAPDLAVEVVSPNDLSDEVEEKRDEWLAAGVREVWIVNVPRRTVRVHRADGGYAFLREADTLTTGVLPGFSCPVADLFRLPGGAAAPPGPVQ